MSPRLSVAVLAAFVVAVLFVSGCTTLSNKLGIGTGSGNDQGGGNVDSKGVGYGPSGGSSGSGSGAQNQTTPAEPGQPPAKPAEADWVVPGLESCGTAKDFLVEMPLAAGDFVSVTPLGNLNPPSHTFPTDHVYFMLNKLNEFAAAQAFVVSPADMWITRIVSSEHVSDNYTDYTIDFSPCRELVGRFGHMSSLSERIMQNFSASGCDEYETGGKRFRNCAASVMIKVSASEVIGTAGGNPGQYALDFWAYDARSAPLNYANKARWYDQQAHAVCPLNYFKAGPKTTLEGMLMTEGGMKRTIPPICGEIEQDEPATAQGVWFLKGTVSTYPEDPHIALVHDNFDPSKGAFSIGTSMQKSGLAAGVYYFQPSDIGYVNREFAGVRVDGKAYCYEAAKGGGKKQAIILQLTGETTLRMERLQSDSCGEGPWSFTTDYTDFER
jgi:hypothetical protein